MTGADAMISEPFAGRRLWIAIGLSLVLHLLVASLHGAHHPPPAPVLPPAPVALQWVQLPAKLPLNPPRTLPLPARPSLQIPALSPAAKSYEVLAMPEAPTATPPVSTVPELATAPSRAARVDLASVLAHARTLAREGPPARGTPAQPAWLEQARAPEIERALQREQPGEHHLSNGLIRVVSASGRSYCLQPPPDFARGGPVEMMSIPTTCP